MDEVLARLLHERVAGHLDAVDRLAALEDHRPVAFEARRLAAAWAALLALHATCRTCGDNRRMCSVRRVACAYFVHRLPWERRRFRPARG